MSFSSQVARANHKCRRLDSAGRVPVHAHRDAIDSGQLANGDKSMIRSRSRVSVLINSHLRDTTGSFVTHLFVVHNITILFMRSGR